MSIKSSGADSPKQVPQKFKKPLYFDHHATTPVDARVLETMLPFFSEDFGNAESSQHSFGWTAKAAVEKSRKQVADFLGAESSEILFTSGATESSHHAILGYLEQFGFGQPSSGRIISAPACHIITANTEHKATLAAFERAERLGAEITVLEVDKQGSLTLEQVQKAVRPHTRLVSLMHANNEIGTIHPIGEIGRWLFSKDIVFHVDAAQTLGRFPINVREMGIALLSISGHKLYGPKGIGALYIRKSPKIHLSPIFPGGGQERGLRGGTHNVPGIVGLGRACEIAKLEMPEECARLESMRNALIQSITSKFPNQVQLNGHPTERLCNNVSFTLQGVSPETLMLGLSGFAYSSGSACSSSTGSHVLKAIGLETMDPNMSITRFGLGRMNTAEQVTLLIVALSAVIEKSIQIMHLNEVPARRPQNQPQL